MPVSEISNCCTSFAAPCRSSHTGQTVAGIVQLDGPSTVCAAVAADAGLLDNVIHLDHLLANQFNTEHRQTALSRAGACKG